MVSAGYTVLVQVVHGTPPPPNLGLMDSAPGLGDAVPASGVSDIEIEIVKGR